MKVLQVIDQAFRTTVEEQDDTILWLTQSMRGAGADLTVLLSGHGVHYAVQARRQPALVLGSWKQSEPAEIYRDIRRLVDAGVPVYAVRDDIGERGLQQSTVQDGVALIGRQEIADLYEQADQIWQW